MGQVIGSLETQRIALQAELDAKKGQVERNRLGQFATPAALAEDIIKYAATLFPAGEKVRFLEPAIGTGAFYSALRRLLPEQRISEALGFEVDPHYGVPASSLWENSGLALRLSDFTEEEASARFNLIICNPPYVRHHHLQNGEKSRLQVRTLKASRMKISGLAGLYCHFLGLSHAWMAQDAIAGWLIPSEFMDVNYGQTVKRYLLERVTLLHIHRFDPHEVQFSDALVSSAVVWFRNAPPPADHEVTFSFGGTLLEPKLFRRIPAKVLAHELKWTRFPSADIRSREATPTIADFFQIKRGLATGDNSYFILPEEGLAARGLPKELYRPILPSPRYLPEDEIKADEEGNPSIERRLFLLDTRLNEEEIKARFPTLWTYLEDGKARGLHQRYLCCHRSPWYSQEHRPPAPIVCTYLGRKDAKRKRPFRFTLNNSRATVANVYLAMYPTPLLARSLERDPALIRRIWEVLNELAPDRLPGEGRVYGGGLHKLEPRELANVNASAISQLIPDFSKPVSKLQLDMFG
ncbi:MAG: Eco57I restriction-modification methylase domain-containing protein [Candidatus Binatia bacterium]